MHSVLKRCLPPAAVLASLLSSTCVANASVMDYIRMVRPQVLEQLDTDMVRLVNELPHVDHQNEMIVGRLFAHGGLGKADQGKDGVWHMNLKVVKGEFLWNPAVIVMKEAGVLELEINNPDTFSHHAALLPNNGNLTYVHLPMSHTGRARIQLDGPGLYWFGCPVANHAGRGMLGLILVGGEVPDEARLDRPKQKRP